MKFKIGERVVVNNESRFTITEPGSKGIIKEIDQRQRYLVSFYYIPRIGHINDMYCNYTFTIPEVCLDLINQSFLDIT